MIYEDGKAIAVNPDSWNSLGTMGSFTPPRNQPVLRLPPPVQPLSHEEPMEKNVNHPTRYTKGKVECIDALESAVVGKPPDEAICVANVIKYLWRYEEKEPLRSVKSAEWYLKRLISKLEAKESPNEEVRTSD